MANITKIVSETSALLDRKFEDDIVDLSLIDGWDELEPDQQRYLLEYIEYFPKKTRACMKAGISTGLVNKWFKEDRTFQNVADSIKDLYAESLHAQNLDEARTNAKIRGAQLRALDADGWQAKENKGVKNQQNNIFVGEGSGGGLGALLNALNGTQKDPNQIEN